MLGTATAIIALILLYLFPQHLPIDGGSGSGVDFSSALYLLPFMILLLQIARRLYERENSRVLLLF